MSPRQAQERAGRCAAAHDDDPTPCVGPHDAVRILDPQDYEVWGCEHHAARLLASIEGARAYPGSVSGAATRAYKASDTIRPFAWVDGPRTRADQLSRAETRGRGERP